MGRVFHIQASNDPETGAWWAESDDVPGLVSEAPTLDALIQRVSDVVPELLALNKGISGPFSLEFHCTHRVELAA